MFICDEDMGVKVRNEDGSNMNKLKVVGYLKDLYEDSNKRTRILRINRMQRHFLENKKMLCFVISFMFNVYFVLKCKC